MSQKKFFLITTETKTFTSKKLIEEAQNLGAETLVVNPLKTSLIVAGKDFLIINDKGKEIDTPTGVYRKTITTSKAKSIEITFAEKGARIINPPQKPNKFPRGKFSVYQILAKNKIPVPKSFLLTNLKERDLCLDFFKRRFPLVIKTNAGTHGVGVFLVESINAFLSLTDYLLQEKDPQIIVQEFIKTSFGRDKRVVVLKEKILAAVERRNEKGNFRSNVFLGANVYPTKINEKEKKVVLTTMKVLGLNFGGLDVLFGKKGPVITEVNAPCDYSFVEKTTGIPISREIVKFLLNFNQKSS